MDAEPMVRAVTMDFIMKKFCILFLSGHLLNYMNISSIVISNQNNVLIDAGLCFESSYCGLYNEKVLHIFSKLSSVKTI